MRKVFVFILISALAFCSFGDLYAAPKKTKNRKIVKPAPKKLEPQRNFPFLPKTFVPMPAPVRVAPPPKPVVVPVKQKPAFADLGLKTGLNAGVFAVGVDFDYPMPNLSRGFAARISAGYLSGNNPNSSASIDNPMKAGVIKFGAIYNLVGNRIFSLPLNWYFGASYLLPVAVNNSRSGGWGIEAIIGAKFNGNVPGKLYIETGYSGLKYSLDTPALKGINATIGYCYTF